MKFVEVAWAAFVFPLAEKEGETAYTDLFRQKDLLQTVRTSPDRVSDEQFNEVLKFLRRWQGRHIVDNAAVPGQFLYTLRLEVNNIRLLEAKKLEAVDLQQLRGSIEQLFKALSNINWQNAAQHKVHLGDVFASKLAHILAPSLFVMWDTSIKDGYKDVASTYWEFLKIMQEKARSAVSDFRSLVGAEDIGTYLSDRFKWTAPKTLAKFLDEYNYLRFTKKILLPPAPHETDLVRDMVAWS